MTTSRAIQFKLETAFQQNSPENLLENAPIAAETPRTLVTNGLENKRILFQRIIDATGYPAIDYSHPQFEAEGVQYFCTDKTEPFEEENKGLHCTQRNSVELAVAGGNIYRLLMGDQQPTYYAASTLTNSPSNEEPLYYRLSSEIKGLLAPDFEKDAPIIGSIMAHVFGYFLGDDDLQNCGLLEEKGQYKVVKYDPECCFYKLIFREKESIKQHLLFICSEQQIEFEDCSDPEIETFGEDVPEFFGLSLTYNIFEKPAFANIFTSPQRLEEAWIALVKIIGTPFKDYENIINNTITDKVLCRQVNQLLEERQRIFCEVAYEIPGFKDFLEKQAYLQSEIYQYYFEDKKQTFHSDKIIPNDEIFPVLYQPKLIVNALLPALDNEACTNSEEEYSSSEQTDHEKSSDSEEEHDEPNAKRLRR